MPKPLVEDLPRPDTLDLKPIHGAHPLGGTATCTNASAGATVVDNVELDQSPYEVEAADGEALDCSVSTSLSVNGGAAATVGDPATETVTPDMASGLPIWLLYQATQ